MRSSAECIYMSDRREDHAHGQDASEAAEASIRKSQRLAQNLMRTFSVARYQTSVFSPSASCAEQGAATAEKRIIQAMPRRQNGHSLQLALLDVTNGGIKKPRNLLKLRSAICAYFQHKSYDPSQSQAESRLHMAMIIAGLQHQWEEELSWCRERFPAF
jgi:hypothetical protein